MLHVLLLLLVKDLAACAECPTVFPKSLELNSQEDVDGLADCTKIDSDVLLGSSNCDQPSQITSLASFERITSISGRLKISCLSKLTRMNGFDSLTNLSGLHIDNNFDLKMVKAFPRLSTIDGALVITNNVNLTTIAGFEELTAVRDYVQIERNWKLTSLSGLTRLQQIEGKSLSGYFALSVVNNFQLQTLDGFRSLTRISEGTVHIEGNRNLCFAGYPVWDYGRYKSRPQSGAYDKGIDWRTRLLTPDTKLWRWVSGNIPTLLVQNNGDTGDCESASCSSVCTIGAGCLGPESSLCGICRKDRYVSTCTDLDPPKTSTDSCSSDSWWPPFHPPYLIIFIIIVVMVVIAIVGIFVCVYWRCKRRHLMRKGSFRLTETKSTENLPTEIETGIDEGGISMHAIRIIDTNPTEEPYSQTIVQSISETPAEDIEHAKKEKEERKLHQKQQKELAKQEKERLKREREEQKLQAKQLKKFSNAKADNSLVIENIGMACTDSLLQEQATQSQTSVPSHIHINYPREQLTFGEEMGKGTNYQVFEATAQRIISGLKKTKVVVKQLKNPATIVEKQQFLKEIQHIKTLDQHENLVSLLGLCTEIEPFIAILECCAQGNLKTYLVHHRWDAAAVRERGVHVRMATDIACGLDYLHQHNHIHNDMAARNCQVAIDSSIKIGDYGLAQEVFRDDYHLIENLNRIVPIRWLAPEILTIDEESATLVAQTQASNVWSFGITLWEVMSFGQKPYNQLSNEEVMYSVIFDKTSQLENPLEPGQQPQESFLVMQSCWLPPESRPTMAQVHETLDHLRRSGELPGRFCDQFDPEKRLSLLQSRNSEIKPTLSQAARLATMKQPPFSAAVQRPHTGPHGGSTGSPTIVPRQVQQAVTMDVTQSSTGSPVLRGSPPITAARVAKRTAVLEALANSQKANLLEVYEASLDTQNNLQDEELHPKKSTLKSLSAKTGPKKTVNFPETNLTQTIEVSMVSLRSLEDFDIESALANDESDEEDNDTATDGQTYLSDTLTRKKRRDQDSTDAADLIATDLDAVKQTKASPIQNELESEAASSASGEDKAALIW